MSAVTINRYFGGAMECSVPPDAIVCELKICELCGKRFVRPRSATVPMEMDLEFDDHFHDTGGHVSFRKDCGERLCHGCRFMRVDTKTKAEALGILQELYRQQLPAIEKQHRSAHLIRYPRHA
jgi:hypothetical protein